MNHTRVFKALWENQRSINLFRGGARSSKTYSIIQAITYWFMSGYFGEQHIPVGTVSIVRQTLPSLKASAYRDFINMLHECQFYRRVEHRKTTMDFTYGRRMVQFFPSDDLNSEKLRGRQHSIVYINEANTVTWEAFVQLSIRTENFMILDYNPANNGNEKENWIKTRLEEQRAAEMGDVALDVSTYYDNKQNLPQRMIDEIEGLKKSDFDLYQVYTRGNWVKARNLVFPSFHTVDHMPTEFDREFFGVDFGYIDPTVCVRVLIAGKDLFIDQVFYRTKADIHELVMTLRNEGVRKVFCDHNPLSIQEMKNYGIHAKKAFKGRDSIRQGVGFMRSFRIHVTEWSSEVIKEFRQYKYKLDKDNEPLPEPVDAYNHSIDAARYALSTVIRSSAIRFV